MTENTSPSTARRRLPAPVLRARKPGSVALGALVALMLGTSLAAAQVQTRPPGVTSYPITPAPIPGQNLSPPAPRQNLTPPPPRPTRPGEGDSTTRIQNDWKSRMPAPANPGQ